MSTQFWRFFRVVIKWVEWEGRREGRMGERSRREGSSMYPFLSKEAPVGFK